MIEFLNIFIPYILGCLVSYLIAHPLRQWQRKDRSMKRRRLHDGSMEKKGGRMSVVVRGMEMPYGCANCNFVGSPIYDCKGRAIYSCNVPVDGISGKNVTEQVIDMYEGGGGDYFPDWCPLIKLPDHHGRLIDENEVLSWVTNDWRKEYDDRSGHLVLGR